MFVTRTEQAWLGEARALILQRHFGPAQVTLNQALAEYPSSMALRRAQAGVFRQMGRDKDAETLLRALLANDIDDVASAFTLARMLKDQGRTAAAAAVLRAPLVTDTHIRDSDLAIQAIELLDDCDHKRDAAAIAAAAIAKNPADARLHAYAGMLEIQLGEFERARRHYLLALQYDERAWEWHAPIGLSSTQRYRDNTHPDFALFRKRLLREGLSDKVRAELHFALAKAHDDIGEYEQAARHFREGNAIAHRLTKWSRKTWRLTVESRLASAPFICSAEPVEGFSPIFIVGMPRSGTTLLAKLLSCRPNVCNRGELPWIARLAGQPALTGNPDRIELQRAAFTYAAQVRRDDAGETRWFIDKQPLNFRYLDLMIAMFPDAHVIYCQRGARDIALSLWAQCFLEDVQGYAYDFDDITLVMRDCERLMTLWGQRFPNSIRSVKYEELVSAPDTIIEELAGWLGLAARHDDEQKEMAKSPSSISTASLWQVRQPVYTNSAGRWKNYATEVPELLKLQE